MSSYKVEIRSKGESSFVSNGIRLPDEEQAKRYGSDLWSRWMAVEEWRVVPSEDAPNHTADEYGRLTRIPVLFSVTDIMRELDKSENVPASMQAQIYRGLKALEHVIIEAKLINHDVTNGDDFAVQIMNLITLAENVSNGMANVPENWKE